MVAFQNQCVSNGLKMTMYLMSVIKTLSTNRHLLLINQNQILNYYSPDITNVRSVSKVRPVVVTALIINL